MARASTKTLLPLDRFAYCLGIDPLHFNQISHGTCGDVLYQYAWQHGGRLGREDISIAIAHAEALIADKLGFLPAPDWREIVVPFSNRATRAIVVSPLGRFIEAGQKVKDLIDSEVDVVYSDEDDDDVDELATITQATTVTDPDEIAIYYPGHSGDDTWEIRPVSVSIAMGTATITCKRWFLVSEARLEVPTFGEDAGEVDIEDDTAFLETVDVYRKYTDPAVQAQFEGYWGCGQCSGNGCSTCGVTTQSACIGVRDSVAGVLTFSAATWDVINSRFGTPSQCGLAAPARIRFWMKSGWQNTDGSKTAMDFRMERAISLLAIALLGPDGLCSCLESLQSRWSEDLALSQSESNAGDGSSTSYKLSRARLAAPFGTTRGGLAAWDLVQEIMNGVSLG